MIKNKIKSVLGDDTWRSLAQLKKINRNNQIKKMITIGETKAVNFELNSFSNEVLGYVETLKVKNFSYLFSKSVTNTTLYSSVYACMIKGLFNKIQDEEKLDWATYFNNFQRDDGLFVDPICYNSTYETGDGWGARHLQGHIIVAYQRLNQIPLKEFSFLKPLLHPDKMIKWLNSLNFNNIWAVSNEIMNYGISFQYARDFMNMNCDTTIEALQFWLLNKIRKDCGMWYSGSLKTRQSYYEVIRGAYHIFPILFYDNISIPYTEQALDVIIHSQNKWGGFDYKIASSACADIDAIDPLLRLASYNHWDKSLIKPLIKKSLSWVFTNQRDDGGFVFDYEKPFIYGNESELSSELYQSNIFASWFRTLSILYIESYLDEVDINFLESPGYEYPIVKK